MSSIDVLLQSPAFFDAAYQAYRRDPAAVPPDLAECFRALERGASPRAPAFLTEDGGLPEGIARGQFSPGIQIYDLVHTYRQFGHMASSVAAAGKEVPCRSTRPAWAR